MSERAEPLTIARVVVPLDAASENRTAIETAARLAARARVPLHGVFVEDEDLLRLARLPFARQHTLGAAAEPLTSAHVELHLQLAAERARRALVAAAERNDVTASFEIVRGGSTSAFAAASETDLVVAGALTRPIGTHFRIECRWWSSVEVAPGPFLLARGEWSAEGTVVVLLGERGDVAPRLLDAAADIAQGADIALVILGPPNPAGPELKEWIRHRLGDRPVRTRFEAAPADPALLGRLLADLDCRLLAVTGGGEDRASRMRALAEFCGCDVLIVG